MNSYHWTMVNLLLLTSVQKHEVWLHTRKTYKYARTIQSPTFLTFSPFLPGIKVSRYKTLPHYWFKNFSQNSLISSRKVCKNVQFGCGKTAYATNEVPTIMDGARLQCQMFGVFIYIHSHGMYEKTYLIIRESIFPEDVSSNNWIRDNNKWFGSKSKFVDRTVLQG